MGSQKRGDQHFSTSRSAVFQYEKLSFSVFTSSSYVGKINIPKTFDAAAIAKVRQLINYDFWIIDYAWAYSSSSQEAAAGLLL